MVAGFAEVIEKREIFVAGPDTYRIDNSSAYTNSQRPSILKES
jgi:hypothetical protein